MEGGVRRQYAIPASPAIAKPGNSNAYPLSENARSTTSRISRGESNTSAIRGGSTGRRTPLRRVQKLLGEALGLLTDCHRGPGVAIWIVLGSYGPSNVVQSLSARAGTEVVVLPTIGGRGGGSGETRVVVGIAGIDVVTAAPLVVVVEPVGGDVVNVVGGIVREVIGSEVETVGKVSEVVGNVGKVGNVGFGNAAAGRTAMSPSAATATLSKGATTERITPPGRSDPPAECTTQTIVIPAKNLRLR